MLPTDLASLATDQGIVATNLAGHCYNQELFPTSLAPDATSLVLGATPQWSIARIEATLPWNPIFIA